MAYSVNKVTLLGNVARDPELRYTPNGNAVATFSIATNRSIKKGDQWEDVASFHRVTVWGKLAEYVGKALIKGDKVYAEGRLDYRNYEKNGQKVYVTDVVLDSVIALTKHEQRAQQDDETVAAVEDSGLMEPPANYQKSEDISDDIPF